MNRLAVLLLVWGIAVSMSAFSTSSAFAAEIDYVEDFVLAKDRTVPLKQLIPGTEEYYYYHCLHFQNTEQFGKVEELLTAWIKRYNYTPSVIKIQNRQALLTYEKNPQQSLEHIRARMGIQFDHQRTLLDQKPNLPTRLDQAVISRATLTELAKARYENLQGFEDAALDWLVGVNWEPLRRRHLLQRLQRPDHPNLPKLVVDDLNHEHSPGFGAFPIHQQLLLAQLDECLKLRPQLLNEGNFVNAYLSKLHAGDDVDWQLDPREHEAYLDRLWAFVSRLAPVHNSLKAHVLYHRLVHDRAHGVYDKDRFLTYIKLPRNAVYMKPEYLNLGPQRGFHADLNANFQPVTLLGVIGNDEPLVRSYLHHFFLTETNYKPYEPYLNDAYLKHNFAETKIVNGLGEPEQWYSMLPPELYRALQQRIDIDFATTNKRLLGPDERVSLDVDVKNVKSLIVKVFEINSFNFFRQAGAELDTDVNLDGLVANDEKTYTYEEPALRRVRRHFEFPTMTGRGTYVVDFIGNGKSSRALIRKGKLRALVRTSTAGHVFTVLDEANAKVTDAAIWISGHKYEPQNDGTIVAPFSTQPGRQPMVISHGNFASLDHFEHQAENYVLTAGIYVDRESLLKRMKAQVVVRPGLSVNGTPVSLSVLEDVRLVIASTDHDGIATMKEVPNFKLFEDRESVYEFQVPPRLSQLSFLLKAKVQHLSQGNKLDLSVQETMALNEIDRTEKIEDLQFSRIDGSYVVDLLGKTGETKPDRPVRFVIKHRDFRDPVQVTLQSDDQGRIALGKLAEIVSVQATGPEETAHTWPLLDDQHTYQQVVHGRVGEPVQLPYMGRSAEPVRSELSLLELRGDSFVADRFDAISIKNGLLYVDGLARGDYDLLLKESETRIRLRVADGEERHGYVLGENRQLEQRVSRPLQIASIDVAEETLRIQLTNANKFARVHVFATRYQPAYSAFATLSSVSDAEPYLIRLPKVESRFIEGRNIGDEYRYIIDRKYAQKYPSNMLKRPSLLLNPWPVRKTETEQQVAAEGGDFAAAGAMGGSGRARGETLAAQVAQLRDFTNLDFLAYSSAVLLNLVPNKDGVVTIARKDLGDHQQVLVVAVDPQTTAERSITLPETHADPVDLRLANGLDPQKHFTEQKQISVIGRKQSFVLSDITTSKFEAYDSLAKVYALYVTLSSDPKLVEFGFLLNWPKMKPEEKRAKYSKFACHELNFFLFKKDPDFFQQVVLPYLANKNAPTFLDRWLLADDLSDYLQPWAHSQLNAVERILCAQRVQNEPASTSRHVQDLFDLLPPNPDRFNHLFDTALKGSALETSDAWGFNKALDAAMPTDAYRVLAENLQAEPESAAAAPPAPGGFGGGLGGGAGLQNEDKKRSAGRRGFAKQQFGVPLSESKPDDAAKYAADGLALKAKRELRAEWGDRIANGVLDGDVKTGVSAYFADEERLREEVRQLYRKLDKTEEWAENNYYHLPITEQNAELITVNSFWRDYAFHDPAQPFYSVNLAEASRNFPEMMFALALLDVPFEAGEHKSDFDKAKMTLAAASPMFVFHREIQPAQAIAEQTPILVSQNFFRHGDRYRHVNNEQLDKYVTDEFVAQAVYGCQIVVTNPTSAPQKLDVLLQVPMGAIPVLNAEFTKSVHVDLQPYHTQTIEYHFYFPAAGQFRHYPVHVAKNEELLAFATPVTLNVVAKPTKIDRESWEFVSQHGSEDDVLAFLKTHNLRRIDLEKIAFRMADGQFFQTVVSLLSQRHDYNHTLWSYAIKHNVVPAVREFLQHADGFVTECGEYIDSPLLTIDPVVRKTYEHLDYSPLVNARTHQLGVRRQILNDRFHEQYQNLLQVLSFKRDLNDDDLMAVTHYMLLQDRIDTALDFFSRVNADRLQSRLQYDYFAAYLDLFTERPDLARGIATKYTGHPVDRWREAFTDVVTQVKEAAPAAVASAGRKDDAVVASTDTAQAVTAAVAQAAAARNVSQSKPAVDEPATPADGEDRTKAQTQLAATEPNFEFQVEAKRIRIEYQNLKQIHVNYYLMDIELLFSRNPFVQQFSGQFSYIRPNLTQSLDLPDGETTHAFDLPGQFHNNNVLVEIIGAGLTKSQAYYSNSLAAQVIENYGQVRVTHEESGRPLSKVYVKVFAEMQDGRVEFFKDGYSDLRGRFDFTSLNTNELDFVKRFSLLILSDEHGAVVKEASPPKR